MRHWDTETLRHLYSWIKICAYAYAYSKNETIRHWDALFHGSNEIMLTHTLVIYKWDIETLRHLYSWIKICAYAYACIQRMRQ